MSIKDGKSAPQPTPKPPEEPKPLHVRLLKFLFGHVGMFLLVGTVAAVGAWAFVCIERDSEEQRFQVKRTKAKDMGDAMNYLTSYWWHLAAEPNLTYSKWERKIKEHLGTMEEFIIDAVETYNYDGTVDGWTYDWTFSKALLFTITIMTTIGYGHIAPKTSKGQMFTVSYAMIGTPLLLVFLANIGDGMASVFTYTYSRLCCRWCRSTRYQSERVAGKKTKRLSDDTVGKEPYMPTDEVQVPIVITLVLIFAYLAVGALIFTNWEGWEFTSAYYFSFVTLSTIGFGDMVPGNSFLDRKDGFMAAVKMGVTICYCLIGMALISMCIQMMQEQITTKVRWAGLELGLIQSEEDQRRVVRMRRTKRGAVPETDYLADDSLSRPVTSEKRRRRRKKRREAEALGDLEGGRGHESQQPPPQAPMPAPPRAPVSDDSSDDIFNLA
ncbi:potassium channel subfamily K member 18-like [Pollicipes pollicipes]|uniref:potassium channel subfamily K member 18-like n=1 Tax=Pollicipes pollicipes TaxID=41117 RepID=UPI0018853EB8|nr:potassium channel subfamily K member 18-like [Pollicipes pollicipes]